MPASDLSQTPRREHEKPRARRKLWLGLALLFCCLLAAAALLLCRHVRLGGAWYSVSLETLAPDDWQAEWSQALPRFSRLALLDLRGAALEQEEAERLRALLPAGCELLWSVPIGGASYSSDSTSLTLPNLDAAEAEKLLLFPQLETADLRGSVCYAEMLALSERMPGCDFLWSVTLYGRTALNTDTALDLSGVAISDVDGLSAALAALPALEMLDLRDTGLSLEQTDAVAAAHPGLDIRRTIRIGSRDYDSAQESLNLSGQTLPGVGELSALLARFPALQTVDLHDTGLSREEMTALYGALPELRFLWTVTLYGRAFESDIQQMDLRGIRIRDLTEFTEAVGFFADLNYVDMCACGPSNEEMDALNRAYPDIRIVWMVYLRGNFTYAIRTDATSFTTKLKANPRKQLTSEAADALRYCTDLEALDLGHNRVDDIGMLEPLKKLRYLILAGCGVEDLSPLAGMEELEYVELFANDITDLTPLANKKKLLDVNISNNEITDLSPLFTNPQLERLWASRNPLAEGQKEAAAEALPNCTFDYGAWSATGNGWRKHQRFFEMREFFGLPPID